MPQSEVDYLTLADGTYMFPRKDGILLGGSFGRGQSNLAIDPEISDRILRDNATLFNEMH
jgi:hypothetical protein